MAVIFMEGFENRELIPATNSYLNPSAPLQAGYGGIGQAAELSSSAYYRYTTGGSPATSEFRTLAYAVKLNEGINRVFALPGFSESSTAISASYSDFYLTWNTDGSVTIKYSASQSYRTAPGIVPVGGWSWVSMTCQFSSTATWSVSINGVEVASSAVQGTGNPVAEGWTYVLALGADNNSAAEAILFDDFIITDQNETIPPTKVIDYYPTSTSTGQWTGSDGNSTDNHLLVNDPSDTATYVEASSAGLTDLYGFSPGFSADPRALQFFTACRYDGIGDGTMDLVMSSGGTEATTSIVPVDAWSWYLSIYSIDPNTGSPWTAAAANAALHGVRTT